jgi:hypothetical protein
MYGPLLVAIILIPIFLALLFFAIFPYKIYEHYYDKANYIDPKYENTTHFDNMNYEAKRLEEAGQKELLIKLQKNYKRKKFWYKAWSDYETLRSIVFVILCIAVIMFLLVSIIIPLCVRTELAEWKEFTTIAEEIMASSTNEIERAGIVNKMLEYNEWLADARASQKLWGNWSAYYNFDLPEPLLLP